MSKENILKELKSLLGDDSLVINDEALKLAEQTNYKTNEKIIAIVYPDTVEVLKQCLLITNKYKIPVYPISKGKNWGYGSRVPLKTNSIIIDLSKLNQILDYNESLGYVTVQPGVTFQQLFDFLREKKSELIISVTGSSKHSSLIGNALDRGVGTGLYADRFSSICNLEVMLSDGKLIRTGFGRFGNTTTAKVYRWGMGPSLDSLFSQSNLGIVTEMTIWLMPTPNYFQLLFYTINDSKRLPDLINTLRELALNGLVRPTITIYNDFRVISTISQYPWVKCDPNVDSPEVAMKLLKNDTGINDIVGAWNGEISIRSVSLEHGKIQYDLIKEAIQNKVDTITLVEVAKEEILDTLQAQYNGTYLSKESNLIKSFLLGKYIGIPNDMAIRQTYWRKKQTIPLHMDPDRDKCGMIWICPVVPFTKEDVELAIQIIEGIIIKYYFEPSISLQCMSERAINIIASISWDREVLEEDEKAIKCYTEINEILNKNGYFAYRNTTLGMKIKKNKSNSEDNYDTILNKIKCAFDPQNIIAPGKYI